MGKKDPRVGAYIKGAAKFAQPILRHLRAVVHEACPEAEETVKWRFPHFMHHGILCSMAAFKEHCAFGFWKGGLILEGATATEREAMGQFGRITSVSDLPSKATLVRYVRKAAKLNETGVKPPKPAAGKRRAEAPMPEALRAALDRHPKAKAAFEGRGVRMEPVLNREMLADNQCFGCGHHNPRGLHIEVFRDSRRPEALLGRFVPTEDLTGFPGIIHGGAVYTALDCLSTWVSVVLGPNREAGWVLRSASTVYHRPAHAGQPLTLAGWIKDQGGSWDPMVVRTEARRADGELCVEGEFKVVPLPLDQLAAVAGLDRLPDNWRAFLSDAP
jgi:acyl-coenzyme A thioesterase PaaI-like protein